MEGKSIDAGKTLADYVSGLEYGDILRYQKIEEITGRRRGESLYYRDISKAKRILERRGKMIAHIGGGDYRLLYPGDYSGAYVSEIVKAKKRVEHGGKILKGAPVNDMTAEERTTFNNISDFHARMEAQISGNTVEVRRLGERKHPLMTE